MTLSPPQIQSPTSKLLTREQCPRCAAEGRDTSEDNLGVFDDGHAYCFSCAYYHSQNGQDVEPSEERHSFQYLAWPERGLTEGSLQNFEARTKCDLTGKPISIGFRYPNGDIKVRLIDKKEFYWKKASDGPLAAGLFGRDRFPAGSNKALIITEGELDAISFWQVLRVPAVSVRSSSSAVADCTVDRSWCNSFEKIYLAFDGDVAGRDATHKVAKLFDPRKLYDLKFDASRKDANEFLQHGEEDALRTMFWNAKRYLPDNIVSSFSDFKSILEETPKWGVPYPFPTLTKKTYGIRPGESVLITAQEGIGKTEIMHAILYQLLKETDDHVAAIFLEELRNRLLQAIAGIHLRSPVHLPDTHVTADQIYAAVTEVLQKDDRLYVYSHFGSDDPDILLDTVRLLAVGYGCRRILLDHINMAVSGTSGEADERRKLDYLVTQLEMLVKELGLSLIMVAHVNDDGLTRSSRYISKVADIRIDLSRDVNHPDPFERNVTYLNISKNRYSGETGPAGRIYFDPVTHTYSELEDGQAVPRRPANDNVAIGEVQTA